MSIGGRELLEKALQQEDKQARSILDQYYEAIAALRKKNWTYSEIAEFLKKEGIEVSAAWLNRYCLKKMTPAKRDVVRRKQKKFVTSVGSAKSDVAASKPEPRVSLEKIMRPEEFTFTSFDVDGF